MNIHLKFTNFDKKEINNKLIKKLGDACLSNKDFILRISINESENVKIETIVEEICHIIIMVLSYLKNTKLTRLKEHNIISKIIGILKEENLL